MSAEAKLVELKLELPPAPKAMGVYKPIVVLGNVAYVSGHGPLKSDGSLYVGRIGSEVDQQAGFTAAANRPRDSRYSAGEPWQP